MPRTKMDDLAEELNKDEGFETAEKAPEVKPLLEMPGVQPFMLWGPAPY